jgi:hypothetical protein
MESLTGSGVIERLWDLEATIHFTDPDDFRHAVRVFFKNALDRDSFCDHTILVTGFPVESFITNDDDDDGDPLIPRHRKVLYLKSLSLLIITMRFKRLTRPSSNEAITGATQTTLRYLVRISSYQNG